MSLPIYKLSIAGLIITLAGCAASQPRWYKEGVSREQTRTAYAECRYEIGMSDQSKADGQEMLRYCMERQDFRLRR
ncbi:hypothetical protein ELY33_05010 [Vreelandella andesensis]|uniref:Uncharacterized protein n=1 Tax=Vreelandella andesensis TaxID=447567 RepID=A0A3S1DRW0_9GAMM|nr:hypothetical protein [Halomonas andesensis]RUR32742.1 hypothetical protein ELY33_05010 [Halomonas andesensis]